MPNIFRPGSRLTDADIPDGITYQEFSTTARVYIPPVKRAFAEAAKLGFWRADFHTWDRFRGPGVRPLHGGYWTWKTAGFGHSLTERMHRETVEILARLGTILREVRAGAPDELPPRGADQPHPGYPYGGCFPTWLALAQLELTNAAEARKHATSERAQEHAAWKDVRELNLSPFDAERRFLVAEDYPFGGILGDGEDRVRLKPNDTHRHPEFGVIQLVRFGRSWAETRPAVWRSAGFDRGGGRMRWAYWKPWAEETDMIIGMTPSIGSLEALDAYAAELTYLAEAAP
jgi:hypothetical protein